MKRREFLRTTSAVCAGMAITKAMPMLADTAAANGWKTFEVTARVEVLKHQRKYLCAGVPKGVYSVGPLGAKTEIPDKEEYL